MIFPDQITAGTYFTTLVTLDDYSPPNWELSVYLRGPGAIDLGSEAEGAGFRISVPVNQTANWEPGVYAYSARVTHVTRVFEVETGRITIARDLAQAGAGVDARSHARRVLDAINAVIERRATLDQERYTINNRELWRTPIADLMKLRTYYLSLVREEDRKARGGSSALRQWRVRI